MFSLADDTKKQKFKFFEFQNLKKVWLCLAEPLLCYLKVLFSASLLVNFIQCSDIKCVQQMYVNAVESADPLVVDLHDFLLRC